MIKRLLVAQSAYEGAMAVELMHSGLAVERQVVYPLVYRDEYIGAYIADMVLDNTIIVEPKSMAKLNEVMEAQP
jgi:GxxExxY protein